MDRRALALRGLLESGFVAVSVERGAQQAEKDAYEDAGNAEQDSAFNQGN